MTSLVPHNNNDNNNKTVVNTKSLLSRLPGIEDPDTMALIGRSRLSQALELEEKPDNRYLRLSLYGLGVAALIFFPWAALTPITQVVHASGEVIPEGNINVVQHLEGGIVSRVDVEDGQQVREGQVMLELRPTLVQSDYKAVEQQLKNLMLQQKQLQAVIRGDADVSLDQGKVSVAQRQLLKSRLLNQTDQIAVAEAQIRQKREEIAGLTDQISRFQQEQVLFGEQRGMYVNLVKAGAASRLSLLNADQQLAASNTKLAELKGARAKSQQQLQEALANLRNLRSGLELEHNSQIAALANEEAVVSENIKKLRNQLERTRITAPINGVVSDLRYRTPGSVIAPGAVVMSVVPTDAVKLVEVRVPSGDIGFVTVGQEVEVKLQPYDSSVYGTVPGKVMSIAPSTLQDSVDHRYYYRARVQLDQQHVDEKNKRFPVQVGMPVVADIQGPRRSVLQYLFKPFSRTMNAAMRESV